MSKRNRTTKPTPNTEPDPAREKYNIPQPTKPKSK